MMTRSRRWTFGCVLVLLGLLVEVACNGSNKRPGDDPCEGRECGTVDGVDCGACSGETEECNEEGVCIDHCEGIECGMNGIYDCGGCPGETEHCNEHEHMCVDLCAQRECGDYLWVNCGTCPSAEEECNREGQCVHVCAERECSEPVPGVVCGQCAGGEECGMTGRCHDVTASCPEGMILIEGKGVCIDAYEVTNLEYVEFLSAHGNDCKVGTYDDFRDEYKCYSDFYGSEDYLIFEGEEWIVEEGAAQLPMVDVTFFGAKLACESWGKQLCTLEMWESACGGPGGHAYPYGDTYDECVCNTISEDETCYSVYPVETGSFPECEGGYPGLFDMSGNASEWVDHCRYAPPYYDYHCARMGIGATEEKAGCFFPEVWPERSPYTIQVYGAYARLGFRCCFVLD